MSYDLVIKNGTVIDGSGLPRYRADVGVIGGRIAHIGRIREPARETIDAEGQVVSPGFIDGHTHMDAQINWDPLGTCSVWHGITTVVDNAFATPVLQRPLEYGADVVAYHAGVTTSAAPRQAGSAKSGAASWKSPCSKARRPCWSGVSQRSVKRCDCCSCAWAGSACTQTNNISTQATVVPRRNQSRPSSAMGNSSQ